MDATRKGAGIGGASVAWGRPACTRMGLARGVSSIGAGMSGRSETRLEKWSGMVYSGSSLAGTVGQSIVVSARSHRGTCRGGSRLLREGPWRAVTQYAGTSRNGVGLAVAGVSGAGNGIWGGRAKSGAAGGPARTPLAGQQYLRVEGGT